MPLLLSLSENFDPAGGTWEILAVSFEKIHILELVSCKKRQKKSHIQETVLENRGYLKAVNDTKLLLNEH